MAMEESALERLQRWAEQRVPEDARERVRVVVERLPNAFSICELRAPQIGAPSLPWSRHDIARLRWSEGTRTWTLDWRDAHQWRRYSKLPPTPDIEAILRELSGDAVGLFWRRSSRRRAAAQANDGAVTPAGRG